MGLDMFLKQRIYLEEGKGTIAMHLDGKPLTIPTNKINHIELDIGTWRKANQIHNWFITNVKDDEDDCREFYVPHEKLLELKTLCKKILKNKSLAIDLLPPKMGFFFGGTEIDDWYFKDLKDTIKIIDSIEPVGNIYYQASW